MADFIIDIPSGVLPFVQQVDLEDEIITLSFRFHGRSGAWYVTFLRDNVPILYNIRVVRSPDLLHQYRYIAGLPPGIFIVHDLDGKDSEPDAENFGDRVLFVYRESA